MKAFGFSAPLPVFVTSIFLLSQLATAAPNALSWGYDSDDPCSKIGGKKWVAPRDVRACFTSFPVYPVIKANIIDVINKTIAFHTSVNYEILAPPPFSLEVHEDIPKDLERIKSQSYPSDYHLHLDLSTTFRRLNDGHCVWLNYCYDSLYYNFIPTPLVLLTNPDGSQDVHIAPAAFDIAIAEFSEEIDIWQNALPDGLKGKLDLLSGAKVLEINGQDPFVAVDANAELTGTFQGFGTRQNTFFSTYQVTANGWAYIMGDFAQQSLPMSDNVTMTLKLSGNSTPVTITLPYRARFGPSGVAFTDSASFRQKNCLAASSTNGVDLNKNASSGTVSPALKIPQRFSPDENVLVDATVAQNIILPPGLQPSASNLSASLRVAQFYLLDDGITGVLALGSFSDSSTSELMEALLDGLTDLKKRGATRLIVDLTHNGGGTICIAHFLHRAIIGPKSTTVPQAAMDTQARAGLLAQKIVDALVTNPGLDSNKSLLYNPRRWRNASNVPYNATDDWLEPIVPRIINGHQDMFSARIGQECQPEGFTSTPPSEGLFAAENIAIVNNGWCASSCATFSIPMAKEEGVKTIVVGGKNGVKQEYCGTVGGHSTAFAALDTEIKTTQLKEDPLSPPDLLVNGYQGVTWRLSFGITDPNSPEEWQDHVPTLVLPLTADTANNPEAIWKDVASKVFT